ncbi:MAG TPA: peptidyl-alpha-hydroxyglycine alpha-amidating lyase family protein [Rhizomicrobium sp.]|nr:peptidyl-alpha-hydroxyglycine alpha-amidating lyase family protein [Rhizomicrobium sp.]
MKLRILLAALTAAPLAAMAQPADQPQANPDPTTNRYVAEADFFKLPPGRAMGSSSAVAGDSHGHIWVVGRCGVNNCAGSNLDPVMEFDAQGNFIKAFGAGTMLFPHGFFIDRQDHLWITDGHVGQGPLGKKIGDDVLEFDQNGKLLRTLGQPGVSGAGPDTFHEPNAVLVAPDGSIFVTDGHVPDKGNARVIKFDANGKFLMQWGSHGKGPGQFEMPHCLAMDSRGRLYVGDRGNDRIQVFTQDGKFLGQFSQFGRPSGIAIDRNDVLYSTDSESRAADGYGHHPGWQRGVRIGSLKDGVVTDFIPDTDSTPETSSTSGGEGVWADGRGAVYVAEVKQKTVVKYVKR